MRIAMLSGVLVLDSVLRKLCAKCLNQKNKAAGTQKRAIVQGFADHSEALKKAKLDASRVEQEIIKNIQPISVGV